MQCVLYDNHATVKRTSGKHPSCRLQQPFGPARPTLSSGSCWLEIDTKQ